MTWQIRPTTDFNHDANKNILWIFDINISNSIAFFLWPDSIISESSKVKGSNHAAILWDLWREE